MRTRLALLLAVVVVVPVMSALMPAAHAAGTHVLAQDTTDEEEPAVGEEDETESGGTGTDETDSGSSDEEAETGSGEEGTGEAAAEVGPIWTYQMAKIVIALLVLIGLAIGGAYYNFVHKRQREGV
jgi:hypothetical protein